MDVAAIEAVGRKRRQFEKGGAGIDQQVDALARQHLAARRMPLARCLAAAAGDHLELVAQIGHERAHFGSAFPRLLPVWLDTAESEGALLLLTREELRGERRGAR